MLAGLEQYAAGLRGRPELIWPKPPATEPIKARAGSLGLKGVRCVLWGTYGTVLQVVSGDLLFEHPKDFVTTLALEKTIQEFRMWGSMSRKPGQPSESLMPIYRKLLFDLKATGGQQGDKNPELASEKVWEAIVQKLQKKDYVIDQAQYGSAADFAKKVAFFFHLALQGANAYPGATKAFVELGNRGLVQGLLGNGQCFTPAQLNWALVSQAGCDPDLLISKDLCVLSGMVGSRKPSGRLFQAALEAVKARGLTPDQVLHVGSRLRDDLLGARKVGFKTALFLGDKASAQVDSEDLKNPETRPDVLLTELSQVSLFLTA